MNLTRHATAKLAAVLTLSAGLVLPAAAQANTTGGTAIPEAGGGGTIPQAPPAGGVGTLRAGRAALHGRWQRVAGTLAASRQGDPVLVQRSDGGGAWVTVARATAGSGGAFAARWRPDRVGRFTLRAVPADEVAARASAGLGGATARTTVYRASIATEFGPGFFGTRTACGITLTRATQGVAHKTLPCGTLVEFFSGGRTIRVPVVDRGPYANNAEWDLTTAAARAIRFNGKAYVGSIRVGRVRLAGR